MNADRFVALPARAEMANLAIVTAIFALTFLLCYGGASALSAYVPWRVPMALALDDQLPFIPGAAILYLYDSHRCSCWRRSCCAAWPASCRCSRR